MVVFIVYHSCGKVGEPLGGGIPPGLNRGDGHRRSNSSASTPEPPMTMPAILFTHSSIRLSKRFRKRLTAPIRISHQRPEPRKTPAINTVADSRLPRVSARPNPAKTAAREKMVRGLVRVRKNVEVYMPA